MPWVYILRGSSGWHYIGSTNNLDRRLAEHSNGGTHSTARLGYPLELVASLEVPELAEARKIERELKRKKNPNLAIHLLNHRPATS
jgi:putative endonuclease